VGAWSSNDGCDVLLPLGDGQVGLFAADASVGERAVVICACGDHYGQVGLYLGAGGRFDLIEDVQGIIGVTLIGEIWNIFTLGCCRFCRC